jgi:hypothetical protein
VAVAVIMRRAPAVGSASDGEREDGTRLLLLRDEHDPSSLWSIGADGSDLRRLGDGIGWADLRPQGRREEA